MSDFIGAALATALLWFAIECFAADRYFLTAVLLLGVVGVLFELFRKSG